MESPILIIVNLFAVALSTIAATVALWVAWDVRKKTTQHMVDIVDTSYGYTDSTERNFHGFSIIIKNFGLPMPEMQVSLTFQEKDGFGSFNTTLQSIDIVTDEPSGYSAEDVLCGLVVKFGFQSDKLDPTQKRILTTLEDFRKQRATIRVYCSGYQVESFKVDSLWERRKGFINRSLLGLSERWSLGVFAKDQKSWKQRIQFRQSRRVGFTLRDFIGAIAAEEKRAKPQ